MASIINASTSSGLVQTADTSGVLALQSNGVTVATLNSSGVNAGIQVASNAAPAFSAYQGTQQSMSSAVFTKLTINISEFDTNSNYNTSNYRFTPTVAGYYQVNGRLDLGNSTGGSRVFCSIFKNGSEYKRGSDITTSTGGSNGSALIYFNGSTDYVELYGYIVAATPVSQQGSAYTYFSAAMVRSA